VFATVGSAVAAGAMAVMLGACGANVNVTVDVTGSGHGSVTVVVTVPKATASEVEDLSVGLPVADLLQAGWLVRGPGPGAAGSSVVTASHTFSKLSQIPVLVADIAGAGPVTGRPFRLVVAERRGTLSDRFVASGTIDLRCSVSCFDDPRLAATVGYPLGLPPAELDKLLGPQPARDLSFHFQVSLPGRTTASNVPGGPKRGALVWSPVLGGSASVTATTEDVNLPLLRHLVAAISAGALLVLCSAAYLVGRDRWRSAHGPRPRHRRSRRRNRLRAPVLR